MKTTMPLGSKVHVTFPEDTSNYHMSGMVGNIEKTFESGNVIVVFPEYPSARFLVQEGEFTQVTLWTCVIPPAPRGDYSNGTAWHASYTVCRGAFRSSAEAIRWARKNLDGYPYSLREDPAF